VNAGRAGTFSEPVYSYAQTVVNRAAGLPMDDVRKVLISRRGLAYFATDAGLVRWDGATATLFDRANSPAMQVDYVTSIAEDSDGAIWFGTPKGLLRLRDEQGAEYAFVEGPRAEVDYRFGCSAGRLDLDRHAVSGYAMAQGHRCSRVPARGRPVQEPVRASGCAIRHSHAGAR
jgi:hypothetical protein